MSTLKNTIEQICIKTSANMRGLLSKNLAVPISPDGIISKTGLIITETDNSIKIETQLPDYAIFVEKGRRPGKMPPDAPIRDWVKKHNISEDAVFPIRRKIGKEGIEPRPFASEPLRRMVELIKNACMSSFTESIKKDIKDELSRINDININL